MNDYIAKWEAQPEKIKELTENGVVPIQKDFDDGKDVDIPFLMGQVSGAINDIKPAGDIVKEMVSEAADMLKLGQKYLNGGAQSRL
jgi:NAD(P)H-dependent flavin oxidoreductase YrpB (nitropropane dioxygenase family)